jgi:aspartate oxidase
MDVEVAPNARQLDANRSCDTVVIGSGIAGMSTAYELAMLTRSVSLSTTSHCASQVILHDGFARLAFVLARLGTHADTLAGLRGESAWGGS